MSNTYYQDGDIPVTIQFKTLRNISSKEDNFYGRKILIGLAPISQLLNLGKDSGDGDVTTNVADKSANVRNAVKTRKDGRINVKSGVANKIYSTLENEPNHFHLLNNGITILCERSQLHKDKENLLSLSKPSIANGGHTHDVIREFLRNHPNDDALCKVEIIYIDNSREVNEGLDDEISIARNQQKAVKDVSIAGKRKILDDLHWLNEEMIGRSETDVDLFDPLKLLQVSFLLTPDEKWIEWEGKNLTRASVYSSKSGVLKKFIHFHENNPAAKKFIEKLSIEAKSLYHKFQRTDILKGMFKQIKDDSYTELKDGKYKLKDGWILPIISSLSHFVDYKTMKVNMPNDDVIRGIMAVIYKYGYKTEQNVQTLGKSSASYSFILDLLQTNFDFVSEGKQVFR
jgi:hypothetical protein